MTLLFTGICIGILITVICAYFTGNWWEQKFYHLQYRMEMFKDWRAEQGIPKILKLVFYPWRRKVLYTYFLQDYNKYMERLIIEGTFSETENLEKELYILERNMKRIAIWEAKRILNRHNKCKRCPPLGVHKMGNNPWTVSRSPYHYYVKDTTK